ncbi:hypothetical protein SAY86_028201 [Trapa natans]|uniref:Protein SCAR n=1 Tax=Trapa natans TaxID=22666 RepID=A0AAN7RC01_TRANT|nr:hypothetical protein SAY86_028201 [Trapa natans]
MTTAARGHGLMVRIQQLEADFPPVEKALLLQTNHSLYYSNAGVEWHPQLQMEQSLIAQGDLPRFIMDSYEESRAPPRLFLLDKFDVAGAGACLKRYTDPSSFKVETVPDNLPSFEVQREKKARKTKKKGTRWRNGETPDSTTASHVKLHLLFMEERIENAYNDPARRVKLKKQPMHRSPFDSKSVKSCMEKFVESSSPVSRTIREVTVVPSSLKWTQNDSSEPDLDVVEVNTTNPVKDALQENGIDILSDHVLQGKHFMDNIEDFEPIVCGKTDEVSSTCHTAVDKELVVGREGDRESSVDGFHSDEMASEVENYVDDVAAIESELDISESRPTHNMTSFAKCEIYSDANEDLEIQTENFALQSEGNASDSGNSSVKRSSSLLSSDGESKMGGSTQFGNVGFSEVLPLPGSTIIDSGNLLHDQLPHSKEAFSIGSKDDTLYTGKYIEDNEIYDLREVSQTSSSADLESTSALLNAGSRSHMGSEQDETSSDYMSHATRLSGSDETREHLFYSPIPASDDVTIQSKGDNLAAKCISVDELEVGNLNVCSLDMKHSSDNLDLTSRSESRNGEPDTGDGAENRDKFLLRKESPQSSLPLEEQHKFSPHTGVDESANITFSSVLLPPDSDSVQASDVEEESGDTLIAPMVCLEVSNVSPEEQVHAKNHELLDEAVKEANLSDFDVQHKRGEVEISQTLIGENIGNLTQNKEAGGGELGASFHPDISFAVNVDNSIPDDLMLTRVNLEDTRTVANEPQFLIEEPKFLVEAEKVTLHEENLQEVNNEKEERSCKEATHDRDDADSLTCNFKAVDVVTVPVIPSHDDDSLLDDLVTQEVQAGVIGDSETSLANIGVVPQEKVNLYTAESPCWVKEVGSKVNEVEVAKDIDSVPAVDSDFIAHGNDGILIGFSGSSLYEQNKDGSFCDIGTTTTGSEQGEANHTLLMMENIVSSQNSLLVDPAAASDGLLKLLVDEPAIGPHPAGDATFRSQNLPPIEVQQMNILNQEIFLLPKSEAVLDYGSGMQDEVNYSKFQNSTGASHIIGHQDGDIQSVNSSNKGKHEGCSIKLLEDFSIRQPSLTESSHGSTSNTGLHKSILLPEIGEVRVSEMPPMPPLPPVKWRIGRTQSVPSTQERKSHTFGQGFSPVLKPSLDKENTQTGYPAFEAGAPPARSLSLSPMCPETENSAQIYPCALQVQSLDNYLVVHSTGMNVNPLQGSVWPEATLNKLPEKVSLTSDAKLMHESPLSQSAGGNISSEQHPQSPMVKPTLPVDQMLLETDTEFKYLQENVENVDEKDCSDLKKTRQEQEDPLNSHEETEESADPWALPSSNGGKLNGILIGNIPRPPKPLIDAVAAHDRSKLKKVAERVRPHIAPKQEERNSLLEQIRTKSFNLKPATVTRPSIQQGPQTNLKFAAILEKANAIRQAFAGSDEDDDPDSWSE